MVCDAFPSVGNADQPGFGRGGVTIVLCSKLRGCPFSLKISSSIQNSEGAEVRVVWGCALSRARSHAMAAQGNVTFLAVARTSDRVILASCEHGASIARRPAPWFPATRRWPVPAS